MSHKLLRLILSISRPSASSAQHVFTRWLKRRVNRLGYPATLVPHIGLLWDVPGAHGQLGFACHLDTVDRDAGVKRVVCEHGIYRLASTRRPNPTRCLGADDGAGIYTLLELTRRHVPGRYMCFFNEEIGAIGARTAPDELWPRRVIEFDRRGQHDVVWYHATGPSATLDFAQAVANLLSDNVRGRWFAPSDRGVFTDISHVPLHVSAVNVSVGYENAHTPHETLDSAFLFDLIDIVSERWRTLSNIRVTTRHALDDLRDPFYFAPDPWLHLS